MKAIIELIKSLTDLTPMSRHSWNSDIDKSDPMWQLAVTEYSKDAVYAYRQMKLGKNPNENQTN